jgi:hypothetical protein
MFVRHWLEPSIFFPSKGLRDRSEGHRRYGRGAKCFLSWAGASGAFGDRDALCR